jgi:LacI family transcriptional regulator
MKALYEEKISVPEEIAIIGFDKIEALNIVGMNISFINGPTIEMGRTGMKLLIDNLQSKDGNKKIKRITLLPKIVLKGSEKYIKK